MPEPLIIDCVALARNGRWELARCCRSCHAGIDCEDDFSLDVGPPGAEGSVRWQLCCNAGLAVPLAEMVDAAASTVSQPGA